MAGRSHTNSALKSAFLSRNSPLNKLLMREVDSFSVDKSLPTQVKIVKSREKTYSNQVSFSFHELELCSAR